MATMKPGTKTGIAAPAGATFEALDGALRQLVVEHERLLALTREHRDAISRADARGLHECILKQNEVVQRIAGLERQRQGIVAGLIGPPVGNGKATLSSVTSRAPEPMRTRLTAVSGTLRGVLNTLHREHLAVRMAAETLAAHMEGLMRQVYQKLSHAGTYARRGGMEGTVQVVSSMDVRS